MESLMKNFQNMWISFGGTIRTDNNVFKLHYKWSVIILIIFGVMLSSKQYFGDPIHCDNDSNVIQEVLDMVCWISGTFIVLDVTNEQYYRAHGVEGLGPIVVGNKTYQLLYYQWICVMLCLQALMFYFPRYLWKIWEGNRLDFLVRDLGGPLVSQKWSVDYKEQVKTFILHNDSHNLYLYRFAFCEFLNLINWIVQVLIMNWYLDGKFTSYGYEVMTKPYPIAYNSVFPKKTKCIYTKYGPSGQNINIDALCILPLNVLNEKIFLVLWFWMIFLLIATVACLLYRSLFFFWNQFRVYLLMAQTRNLNCKKMKLLGKHLSAGQLFFLYNIGNNINPTIYKELLLAIFEQQQIKVDHYAFVN